MSGHIALFWKKAGKIMFGTVGNTGVPVPVYGIMTALGIFACFVMLKFTHRTRKIKETIEYAYMGCWSAVGAFFLAHVFFTIAQYRKVIYLFTHGNEVFSDGKHIIMALSDAFGGMVFYGGLVGACAGGYFYLRRNHLDIYEYSDTVVPCIPLFHAFGRIGCFLAGCCYGIESQFGFVYEHSLVESANGVRRFPVQLLESGENLVLCVVLCLLLYRCQHMPHGMLLWVYGILYPPLRFVNEFLRGDNLERGYFGIFSTSQWISLILFAVSLFMTGRTLKRHFSSVSCQQ